MIKQQTMLQQVAAKKNITETEVLGKIAFLFDENRPITKTIHIVENGELRTFRVNCTSIGDIHNEFGHFVEYAFELDDRWSDYSVLVMASKFDELRLPKFEMHDYFLTRFDSACETQMLFGDQTCDCLGQLRIAMRLIAERGEGMVIHIKKHEGRGKGIASKLDQLAICEVLGIDTVAASLLKAELIEGIDIRHFTPTAIIDSRDFNGCVAILKYMGVPANIKLIIQTNNPNKTKTLRENGYTLETMQVHTVANDLNKENLESKREHLNHDL